jgi:hypothetical protein
MEMITILSFIGWGMVLILCLFALMVFYFCFRGGLEHFPRTGRGRLLDKTAWGINGLACLWIALRHRHRLFKLVELSDAEEPDLTDEQDEVLQHGGLVKIRYKDTGVVRALEEGTVVVFYAISEHGHTLYVRRPFQFLERDWMESMKFRRDDGKVT